MLRVWLFPATKNSHDIEKLHSILALGSKCAIPSECPARAPQGTRPQDDRRTKPCRGGARKGRLEPSGSKERQPPCHMHESQKHPVCAGEEAAWNPPSPRRHGCCSPWRLGKASGAASGDFHAPSVGIRAKSSLLARGLKRPLSSRSRMPFARWLPGRGAGDGRARPNSRRTRLRRRLPRSHKEKHKLGLGGPILVRHLRRRAGIPAVCH